MLIDEGDTVVRVGIGVGRIGVKGDHVGVGQKLVQSSSHFILGYGKAVHHTTFGSFFFLISFRLF